MSKKRKSFGRVMSCYGPVGGTPLTINARKGKAQKPVPAPRPISLVKDEGRGGEFGNKTWEREMRRLPCHYCGGPGGTLDHYIPRSHGGRSCYENALPACARCNTMRGAFKYEHFIAAIDYGMLDALIYEPSPNRKRVAYWIMSAMRVQRQRLPAVA